MKIPLIRKRDRWSHTLLTVAGFFALPSLIGLATGHFPVLDKRKGFYWIDRATDPDSFWWMTLFMLGYASACVLLARYHSPWLFIRSARVVASGNRVTVSRWIAWPIILAVIALIGMALDRWL